MKFVFVSAIRGQYQTRYVVQLPKIPSIFTAKNVIIFRHKSLLAINRLDHAEIISNVI